MEQPQRREEITLRLEYVKTAAQVLDVGSLIFAGLHMEQLKQGGERG